MVSVMHAKYTAEEGHNWIEEWKEATSLEVPSICPCCEQIPQNGNYFVGAHVILQDQLYLETKRKFITPTCKRCNDTYKLGNASIRSFLVEDNYLWELDG